MAEPKTQVCSFYAVGKSEKELLAYDEYDSQGSGLYFTDDALMCDRYLSGEAMRIANEKKFKTFEVSIGKAGKGYDVKFRAQEFLSWQEPGEITVIQAPKKKSASKGNLAEI